MTRPIRHYQEAMRAWLLTSTLTDFEIDVVARIATAAEVGEKEFWEAVQESELYLSAPLFSAITKAVAQGHMQTWKDVVTYADA